VRQLAAAGGDLSAVRTGLDRALRLSLAYDLAAISTVDPATMLWTSCFISGMPPGGEDERERILYGLEFDGDDINSYTELANSGQLVGRLHQATDGDLSRARRWGLLLAQFGISDEMRVMLTSRNMVWGSLTLYRRAPRPPFTERDENIVRGALTAMADLFRLAMLRAAIAFAAQGRSTKQIASALGISPFTVQDHLKAVFAKVGVQSRAELVAALYVRHYEPRRTAGSTPGPYGWYLDDYQAAAG
jgi:hypothetical protein